MGMLVLDSFKGHLAPEIKATIIGITVHTDVLVVPGGHTTQLQVLDVVMNKPFTDHQKQLCSEWLLTGDHAFTPAGRIKKPNVALCQWLIMASQRISPEVIVEGFKKCFISSAVDGTDDDLLWNDSEEDGNVRSECGKMKALTVKTETVTLI